MRQYETFELHFTENENHENAFECNISAEFTCGEEKKVVRGFYDGEGVYKIRFLPRKPGEYTWKVSGIVNAEGHEYCDPADEAHHGMVKAVDTHFEFEDGTRFIPFGTTVYALAHQEDALVEETLKTLGAAPFNKIRMCVFPKDYLYNKNEPPCYAFEKKADGAFDASRPCIQFWLRFENILDRITAMGIQVDLILFHPYDRWGFDAMQQADNYIYLDYLLRRLAAKPGIWWSLANEYDLSRTKSLRDWEEIEEYVAKNDPYGHLLSCHNCFCHWDTKRENVTHASLQTKSLTEIPRWIKECKKPVMIDECCYEGNLPQFWGSLSAREMVFRFWRTFASGAYCTHGETYLSDDDVVWWAKGGVLKGESPRRIAFLREIMESLPGPLVPADGGIVELAQMSPEEIEKGIAQQPEDLRDFIRMIAASIGRMRVDDRTAHIGGEHEWAAHVGEEAFLWFNDLMCFGEQTLRLPEDGHFRVELIDVWEMTRTVIEEDVSGETIIRLPGKEGLAVLAMKM